MAALTIDGSAGGGQMLRTALSLAAVDGRAVRVESVRGDRPTPGLRPQHLAAVRALAALTDADVEGAELGSETVTFDPGEGPFVVETLADVDGSDLTDEGADIDADLRVDVDTAGSVALVCDALLPLATRLADPVSVVVTGGTDVKWSPPVDYLRRVKLPLLDQVGLDASCSVTRRGFYPAGGGAVRLELSPSTLDPPTLRHRGAYRETTVVSVASESLAEAAVADRAATAAVETLVGERERERDDGDATAPGSLDADAVTASDVSYVPTRSPGAVVLVRTAFDGVLAGFSALGERGLPAEDVGADAAARCLEWLSGAGAVDPHMADQLLVPLALAGGEVVVPRVTDHVATNATVVRAFGRDVAVEERTDGSALLSVSV